MRFLASSSIDEAAFRFLVQGGSMDLDFDAANLKAQALRHALDRLRMLGLVDGDTVAASAILTRLIGEAFQGGERSQEDLILYAIGRFQSQKPTNGGVVP